MSRTYISFIFEYLDTLGCTKTQAVRVPDDPAALFGDMQDHAEELLCLRDTDAESDTIELRDFHFSREATPH